MIDGKASPALLKSGRAPRVEVRPTRGIRAIAFDLFHTLVDPEDFRPKEFRRTTEVAHLLGVPVEEFAAFWESGLAARTTARSPTVVERVRAYCTERGLAPPERVWPEVTDLLGRYADLALRSPRASILAALGDLRARGFVLGLLSNCDERESRAWPESPLAALLPTAVFSWEIGFAKPAADAYRALVPRWGEVPLREAVFVGDGSNDEIGGARRAGFAKVIFDGEFVLHNGLRSDAANRRLRSEADAEIRGLAELGGLLGR